MNGLVHDVLARAEHSPDAPCVRTIRRRGETAAMTFGQVAEAARSAAAWYRSQAIGPGEVVVLIGTHHPDLYAAWLGAVWVGAVPTILAEPGVRIDRGIYASRLAALLARVQARVVAVDPRVADGLPALGEVPVVTFAEIAAGAPGGAPSPRAPEPGDLMLLQHSSGTTGLQKGVMLTHGAVSRHAEAYREAIALDAQDVVATWLPLYHDMGFIACFVMPLQVGASVLWLSPFEWVADPALLLEAASEHRATLIWLPNFAYPFLAQRTRSPAAGLDLSSLRMVINCSEPVTAEAFDAFATRFSAHGLRPDALHACYAMAENVFAVTTTTDADPPRRVTVDRAAWLSEHRAVPARGGARSQTHVSNGRPIRGCSVRVAGDDGAEVPPGTAGRILITSTFLFDGFYRSASDTPLFDTGGFYDTGDLGWMDADGHVYVTGRRKDLIIVGGRNVYPQDVEAVVMSVPGVQPGRVVCFGAPLRNLETEGLVVLAEASVDEAEWPSVVQRVRASVPAQLDLDLIDARIVARGALRKSTSGKLARAGNCEWYLEGRFGTPSPAVRTLEASP